MSRATVASASLPLARRTFDQQWWDEVERRPWQVSRWAREQLQDHPQDELAWALLGLAQSLLGHYRLAMTAYREALALCPQNPWYAHNLGHLIDEVLGQPERALPWLRLAYRHLPQQREVVASYAHALWRSGALLEAHELARGLVTGPASEAEHSLFGAIAEEYERLLDATMAEQSPPRRRRGVRRSRSTLAP